MTTLTQAQQDFLNQYLTALTDADKQQIPNLNNVSAYHYCTDEYNANECARLVNMGKNKATCYLKEAFIHDNDSFPKVGDIDVITNWAGKPVCIIQTTDISFAQFKDVPEAFAIAEGEGDGTYEWWYKEHVRFFIEDVKKYNMEFNETTELVLERFKKVYPVE